MNKTKAIEIFNLLTPDPEMEKSSVENRIRSGVNKMLASMWKVYWERCFEGNKAEVITIDESLSSIEAAKKLWLDFVVAEKEKWQIHAGKLTKFGRTDDAAKENLKIDQLEKLVKVWQTALLQREEK
jgi:hypothetical protein